MISAREDDEAREALGLPRAPWSVRMAERLLWLNWMVRRNQQNQTSFLDGHPLRPIRRTMIGWAVVFVLWVGYGLLVETGEDVLGPRYLYATLASIVVAMFLARGSFLPLIRAQTYTAGWEAGRRDQLKMLLRRYETDEPEAFANWVATGLMDSHRLTNGRLPQGEPTHVFVCPACRSMSHHPEDVRQGYCGYCHDWTGDARPYAPKTDD